MTVAAFLAALGTITISGVATEYDKPPLSLDTAHLPAQWVQYPSVTDETPRTMAKHGQLWGTQTAQLVVAYEAVGQGNQDANWDGTVAMMDSVWTALAGATTTLGRGRMTYNIRQAIVNVAGNDYWGVIAEVTIRG